MLNEIFKGMDNAAEVINENFESVEINEVINDQEGYLEFPGGTVVCFMREELLDAPKNTTVEFPVTFKEPPIVVTSAYRPGGYNDYATMIKTLTNSYVSITPVVTNSGSPSSGITATVVAIGRV